MTSMNAVIIAWFLQIFLGTSIFVHPKETDKIPGSALASWFFLTGLMDFVMDLNLYPKCYKHLPYVVQLIWETFCAILIAEIGNLIIWYEIENLLSRFTEIVVVSCISQEFYQNWENTLRSIVPIMVSGTFLAYALHATGDQCLLLKKYSKLERAFLMKFDALRYGSSQGKCKAHEPSCTPHKHCAKRPPCPHCRKHRINCCDSRFEI